MGTEMSIVSVASFRLCDRAPRSVGSWNTEFGSPQYQRKERPWKALRERPELNEKSTAITTGSSDHRR